MFYDIANALDVDPAGLINIPEYMKSENKRRILCFGDSNTYGYDPRSFFGERYPEQIRWTGLLKKHYQVINAGQNGRRIPDSPAEYSVAAQMIRENPDIYAYILMLGSNDLLCGLSPERTAQRLENFLCNMRPILSSKCRVFLIAPPPMQLGAWVPDEALCKASVEYARLCRVLAVRENIVFADSGDWDIALSFDGVHFSESGHRSFARQLRNLLSG